MSDPARTHILLIVRRAIEAKGDDPFTVPDIFADLSHLIEMPPTYAWAQSFINDAVKRLIRQRLHRKLPKTANRPALRIWEQFGGRYRRTRSMEASELEACINARARGHRREGQVISIYRQWLNEMQATKAASVSAVTNVFDATGTP